MQRLDKYVSENLPCTRSEAKKYIGFGRISVNGIIVRNPDTKIDENAVKVYYKERELICSKGLYYMLNKPAGVISATEDKKHRTVIDLFPPELRKKLFLVGRLDIDTEGLLLITDDGELIHKLLSPKKHVDKVYEVHIRQRLSEADIDKLENGVNIGDKRDDGSVDLTLPARVEVTDENDEDGNPVIFLTIHEGRFHQVKRMLEAVGNEVLFLRRISMGSLELGDDLAPGEYRTLTDEEVNDLKK